MKTTNISDYISLIYS